MRLYQGDPPRFYFLLSKHLHLFHPPHTLLATIVALEGGYHESLAWCRWRFFFIPQSEYIAECDKRREFISGFTGSAGTGGPLHTLTPSHPHPPIPPCAGVALVTVDKALLWTDGRYHLQASHQLDANWTLMKQGGQ